MFAPNATSAVPELRCYSVSAISPPRQNALKLVDGDTLSPSSKFVDRQMAIAGRSTVEIFLAAPTRIESYTFWTANDNPARDPTAWEVSRLPPNGTWQLPRAVRVVPPLRRHSSYGLMSLWPMGAASRRSKASRSSDHRPNGGAAPPRRPKQAHLHASQRHPRASKGSAVTSTSAEAERQEGGSDAQELDAAFAALMLEKEEAKPKEEAPASSSHKKKMMEKEKKGQEETVTASASSGDESAPEIGSELASDIKPKSKMKPKTKKTKSKKGSKKRRRIQNIGFADSDYDYYNRLQYDSVDEDDQTWADSTKSASSAVPRGHTHLIYKPILTKQPTMLAVPQPYTVHWLNHSRAVLSPPGSWLEPKLEPRQVRSGLGALDARDVRELDALG